MKVLIDTCVIVDSLQNREPFSQSSNKIFLAAANKKIDAYITAKSLTDIYYLTQRITHSNEKTREIIQKLLILYGLLDTAGIDCKKAIVSDISDYEDAVMIQTAIRSGMDCIVTRNVKDYAKAPVKIYDPEDFLNAIKEE